MMVFLSNIILKSSRRKKIDLSSFFNVWRKFSPVKYRKVQVHLFCIIMLFSLPTWVHAKDELDKMTKQYKPNHDSLNSWWRTTSTRNDRKYFHLHPFSCHSQETYIAVDYLGVPETLRDPTLCWSVGAPKSYSSWWVNIWGTAWTKKIYYSIKQRHSAGLSGSRLNKSPLCA